MIVSRDVLFKLLADSLKVEVLEQAFATVKAKYAGMLGAALLGAVAGQLDVAHRDQQCSDSGRCRDPVQ